MTNSQILYGLLRLLWLEVMSLLILAYGCCYALPELIRYMWIWDDDGPEATRRIAVKVREVARRRRSVRLRYAAIMLTEYWKEQMREEGEREIWRRNTMDFKRYLGDGVFIEVDYAIPGQFRLTTEDGINVSNEIYIDHRIIVALNQYIADFNQAASEAITVLGPWSEADKQEADGK
jgi:hypothetical protein